MYKGRKRLLLAAFDFGSHQATDSGLIMAVNVHYCCKCSLRIDALDMVVADFPRRYFSLFCAPVVEGRLLNCVVEIPLPCYCTYIGNRPYKFDKHVLLLTVCFQYPLDQLIF